MATDRPKREHWLNLASEIGAETPPEPEPAADASGQTVGASGAFGSMEPAELPTEASPPTVIRLPTPAAERPKPASKPPADWAHLAASLGLAPDPEDEVPSPTGEFLEELPPHEASGAYAPSRDEARAGIDDDRDVTDFTPPTAAVEDADVVAAGSELASDGAAQIAHAGEEEERDERRRRRHRGRRGRRRGVEQSAAAEPDEAAGAGAESADVDSPDIDPRDIDPRDIDPRDIDPRDFGPRRRRSRRRGSRGRRDDREEFAPRGAGFGDRDVDQRDIDPRDIDPRDIDPRGGDEIGWGSGKFSTSITTDEAEDEFTADVDDARLLADRSGADRGEEGRGEEARGQEEGEQERGRRRRRRRRRRGAGGEPKPAIVRDEGQPAEEGDFDEYEGEDVPMDLPTGRQRSPELDEEEEGDEDMPRISHRNIPSWEEAIGAVIAVNMEARARSPQSQRGRGRGDRGGRRGRGRGRDERRG